MLTHVAVSRSCVNHDIYTMSYVYIHVSIIYDTCTFQVATLASIHMGDLNSALHMKHDDN